MYNISKNKKISGKNRNGAEIINHVGLILLYQPNMETIVSSKLSSSFLKFQIAHVQQDFLFSINMSNNLVFTTIILSIFSLG